MVVIAMKGKTQPGGNGEPQFQLDLNPERRAAFVAKSAASLAKARERTVHACQRHGGVEGCRRLAADIDALLVAVLNWLMGEAGVPHEALENLAVVAQGGYGRGELNLRSDIDLLILLPDNPAPIEQALVKSFLYVLWDMGTLDVGYATKKVDEALAAAGQDIDATTALAETRLVAGNPVLLATVTSRLGNLLRGGQRQWYVDAILAGWQQRREKFGGSVYLLEPNLKEGEGGLRDLHSVEWLAHGLLSQSDLSALVDREIWSKAELDAVVGAADFILAMRTLLHQAEGRKVDTLSYDKQPRLARDLGYRGDAIALAEEKMMKDYYLHARVLHRYAEKASRILSAKSRSLLGGMIEAMRRRRVGEHYYRREQVLFLRPPEADYFTEQPTRVMECFRLAADHGLTLSDELKDSLTAAHPAIDTDEFRTSPVVRDHFMRILGLEHGAAATMHAMHETGVLGDYIPEFRHLFCLVRIDHYHRYTVDEHLIKAVEMFESILSGASDERPELLEAARGVERRDLLNLALLLHDIGKGWGRGHVLRGAGISEQVTQRMGLPPDDRETVRQLILLHLKMSHVSQRRDLDDPAVIAEMAATVRSPELLRMLFVLTCCDTRAVGPTAWNDWKSALMADLYCKTALALAGKNPIRTLDGAAVRRLSTAVAEKAGVANERVERFIENAPAKYLNSVTPARMARHFQMIERLGDETRIVHELEEPAGMDFTEIATVSFDQPGLMGLLCGAFASKDINILSVQAYSTKDGRIIDTFQVTDSRGRKLPHGFRLDRLMAGLNKVLQGKATPPDVFQVRGHGETRRATLEQVMPAVVNMDNSSSPDFTLVEVKAHDRPGLLYDITNALSQQNCNIHLAMITTEAYRVVDVFYVTDLEYNKLEPGQLKRLKSAVEGVISI